MIARAVALASKKLTVRDEDCDGIEEAPVAREQPPTILAGGAEAIGGA